jgi:putative transposase
MPEHFHLLVSEPKRDNLSTAMQVLKQRVSLRVRQHRRRTASCRQISFLALTLSDDLHFWQPRFCDFNVFTRRKFVEKLRYIHRNPLTRGLVRQPDQWRWSSFRFYAYGEKGPAQVDYDLPRREPEPVFRKPKS